MNVSLDETGELFHTFQPASHQLKNLHRYDVLFRFRFRGSNNDRFTLILAQQAKNSAGRTLVDFSPTSVTISQEDRESQIKAKIPFAIQKNRWHSAAVKVDRNDIAIHIDDRGEMKEVAKSTLPEPPKAGINFRGYGKSSFSLTDIILRDPAPLRNHSLLDSLGAPAEYSAHSFTKGESLTVEENDIFGAVLRMGEEKEKIALTVNWENGTSREITFESAPFTEIQKVTRDGKTLYEDIVRPDAVIHIGGVDIDNKSKELDYHVRPLLYRYKSNIKNYRTYSSPTRVSAMYDDIVHFWDRLPSASEHLLKVELRHTGQGTDLYLDGKYTDTLEGGRVKTSFSLPLPALLLANRSPKSTSSIRRSTSRWIYRLRAWQNRLKLPALPSSRDFQR